MPHEIHPTFRSTGPMVQLIMALALVCATAPGQGQCPTAWDDAGVPIPDPDPPTPIGTPPLNITGLAQFVATEGLTSVAQLLDALPLAMRRNYALVESTRTNLLSSVEHPRLIHFGSDARFLMALGSHPDDPLRETVDMAELDDVTGLWRFRSLDMSTTPPTLATNDTACVGCHGSPARPFWGTYPDWPGMFGPMDDRLTAGQAGTLESLRFDGDQTDRFRHLDLLPYPYDEGDSFSLPGRVYPYTNTIFNMELGTAVADGAYRVLRRSALYRGLREEILLRGYCANAVPGFFDSEAWDQYQALVLDLGAEGTDRDDLFRLLGVDPDDTFSLHRLAFETPDPLWNVSTDSLFGLVHLLVLAELMDDVPAVRNLLADQPDLANGFSTGCFDTLDDALRHKRYQGWTLRGEARQAAREAGFDVDLLRSHQGIFDQATSPLCTYLIANVGFDTTITFADGFESGDARAWTITVPD